jgi:hypothetical protein
VFFMNRGISAALTLALLLCAFPGHSAAAERPSSNDLLRQGYQPVAAGRLTMKRIFVVVPRWTGFTTLDDQIVSMAGEGKVPGGGLKPYWAAMVLS